MERERLCADVLLVKNETRRLAFFCWMNGGPPNDLNRAFFGREAYDIPPGLSDVLLREVTESFEYDPGPDDPDTRQKVLASLTTFIRHDILDNYGAARFCARMKDSLRESPLERQLMLLLVSLRELGTHPLLRPHLLDNGIYVAIRDAVKRDALLGHSDDDHFTVLCEALWIYRSVWIIAVILDISHALWPL